MSYVFQFLFHTTLLELNIIIGVIIRMSYQDNYDRRKIRSVVFERCEESMELAIKSKMQYIFWML